MKRLTLVTLCSAALLVPPPARAAEPDPWSFDLSLYFLGIGINGDLGIGPFTAGVDAELGDIVDNLEFGAMGSVRVGYGRWALTTEVLYMGLEASNEGLTAELDQWMVEPSLSYRLHRYVEPLAGARYNNLNGELRGEGLFPTRRVPSGTQEWWDPIVGANLRLPFGRQFSLHFRGDIGGFGVGSDMAWQAFPYANWQFTGWGSLQAGYRWLYMDYETGSGADRFLYDMMNQGAQLGLTFHF